MAKRKGRKRFIVPIAFIVIVYLATSATLAPDGFWINDNGCKFIVLEGMLKTGYRDYAIPWPGQEIDPEFRFSPLPAPFGAVREGRLFCQYAPLFSMISSLPFRLLGFRGLYVLPILGGLLILPAAWQLAGLLVGADKRGFTQGVAVVLVALATPLWFYSMTFWEHVPSVCLTLWGVLLGVRYVMGGRLRWLVPAAACLAVSTWLRDDAYIFSAVVCLFVALYGRERLPALIVFAASYVVTMVPQWAFQWITLGHPLGHHITPHSPLTQGIGPFVRDRWTVTRSLIVNAHGSPLISWANAGLYLAAWATYPRQRRAVFAWRVPVLAVIATAGGVAILWGHLTAASPMRWLLVSNGLFAASPILILAFIRADGDSARVRRMLWWIMTVFVMLYVLAMPLIASSGIHWACRFLFPLYPLMGILAAATIGEYRASLRSPLSAGMVAVWVAAVLSIAMQVYSLTLLHERTRSSARLNRVVAERPEPVIAVYGPDSWFLPQEMFGVFYDKTIFYAFDDAELRRLMSRVREAGHDRLLLVTYPPLRESIGTDRQIVSDEPLGYVTVDLQSIPLRRPEEDRARGLP